MNRYHVVIAIAASWLGCSGSGGGSNACPAPQVDCGGTCVDPASDRLHCGVGAGCAGGEVCDASSLCDSGTCRAPCPAGQAYCSDSCVDPQTSAEHCGASGLCEGDAAGLACRADQHCASGSCACPAGLVDCGGGCVDPATDLAYCGASGSCAGAGAGQACTSGQVCDRGSCSTVQELDWRPARWRTRPPHFVEESGSVLAHIVYDDVGMRMTDGTGHTHWTASGAPGSATNGYWSPAQPLSGPYSATSFWIGDAATRDYLDAQTSGDFTICARYRPGAQPYYGPTKVIMASGMPEGRVDGGGGWSLMQMHDAACFHYRDTYQEDVGPYWRWGEWMAPSQWTGAITSQFPDSLEWSWICGGRDDSVAAAPQLRLLREASLSGTVFPMGLQQFGPDPKPDATFGVAYPMAVDSAAFLPAIGAYSDGSSPLSDGGVYEIVITSDPATAANMANIVARASGGLVEGNDDPLALVGADGVSHSAAPTTVQVAATGDVPGGRRILLGGRIQADPTVHGECLGLVATATDWADLGGADWLLRSVAAGGDSVEVFWLPYFSWALPADRKPEFCVRLVGAGGSDTCGAMPELAPGTEHTFKQCFRPTGGGKGQVTIYLDHGTTPFATSGEDVPASLFPRLDLRSTVTSLENSAASLRVRRVFACPGSDPGSCT